MAPKSTTALLNQHGTGKGSDKSGLDFPAAKALTRKAKVKAFKTPDTKIPKPLKPYAGKGGTVGKKGKMTGMKTAGALRVMEAAGLVKVAAMGDSLRSMLGGETEADRAERAARIGGAIPILGPLAAGVGGGRAGGFPGAVGGSAGSSLGLSGGLVGGSVAGGGAGALLSALTRGRIDPEAAMEAGSLLGRLGGGWAGSSLGGGAGARWAVENS